MMMILIHRISACKCILGYLVDFYNKLIYFSIWNTKTEMFKMTMISMMDL